MLVQKVSKCCLCLCKCWKTFKAPCSWLFFRAIVPFSGLISIFNPWFSIVCVKRICCVHQWWNCQTLPFCHFWDRAGSTGRVGAEGLVSVISSPSALSVVGNQEGVHILVLVTLYQGIPVVMYACIKTWMDYMDVTCTNAGEGFKNKKCGNFHTGGGQTHSTLFFFVNKLF